MIPIEIKGTDHIVLDAGTIEETAEHFTIRPVPAISVIQGKIARQTAHW